MSTLNEPNTVCSHPATACHHVLARQERSPRLHIPSRESGSILSEQCTSGNTVQSQVGEERGLATKFIHFFFLFYFIYLFIFFFYHFYFFKPPLMLTYLTYRNKLSAFDVFRFLLEMAEELISLKVRLKSRFKTIEAIDISNMKGNLIPQSGSWNIKWIFIKLCSWIWNMKEIVIDWTEISVVGFRNFL